MAKKAPKLAEVLEANVGQGHSAHGHDHDREGGHGSHLHELAEHAHAGHDHAHTGHDHAHAGHDHAEGPLRKSWTRVIIGGAIMGAGIILDHVFEMDLWVSFAIFFAAYLILGLDVVAAAGSNIAHGKIFDENFLMTVATAGTFVLGILQRNGDFAEACAVMLLYQIGELLTDQAVDKSRDSITRLMDIRPDYANLSTDGKVVKVDPASVQPGQIIVIKPGEKVPLDSVVLRGSSSLNTSALTGESLPRDVEKGSTILAGCVNGSGLLEARVEKGYGESSAAKILDIMEHASSNKAQPEKFITKFARYYTPIVCAAALIVAVVPPLFGGSWETWIYRALLFLVISCPCALVVSVPLTYFSGLGAASKNGILIKGANYLEILRNLTEIVFDKTGTLTQGTFSVQQILAAPGHKKEEVLKLAAIAEGDSSHPIARSVVAAYEKAVPQSGRENVRETAGRGVTLTWNGEPLAAGNALLMEDLGVEYEPVEQPGTVLYVSLNHVFIGSVVIADTVKPKAREVIDRLHAMHIRTAMLTGDNCGIGRKVGEDLGIGETYCQLLPEDKVMIMERIESSNDECAFVGDGINDAPVLSIADLGIAMGGVGSDAAIEAADIVLMHDQLSEIPTAVEIAKKTRSIVLQNIIFALAVKSVVMVLGVLGYANMWLAVFADVGVTLIAVVNSLRALFVRAR